MTHSADCWRWHHECAVARIEAVRVVIAPRTAHDCPSCSVLAREVEAAIEGES